MRLIVRTLRTFVYLAPCLSAGLVVANPNGGTVVAGNVDPLPSVGVNFDIGIHSQRAIIDWQSFSIQLGETTRFNFDAASGAVLNRVTTIDPANLSVIAGRLESNGQVILLNPNGILVTPSGVIDTRGFIGTTLSIDPAAFMGGGGRFTFEGSADGSIINQGVVLARAKEGLPGGDVVLIAQTVRNDGTISAPEGLAALAAGTKVTLYDAGDQRIVVEASAPDAEVVNGPEGVIAAVTAELKAAGGNIGALAINNEGVIRANTIVESGGRVFLRASRGTVVNSGTIEAAGNAPGTFGGRVEITGDQVLLASGSSINANGPAGGGTVLVGGDYQGANPEVPNALRTVIAPDAVITANATAAGDGGRVIVWADEVTRFYGYIEALGGPLGGNGGFVETSGKDHLEAVGQVNASASRGAGGVWLLDPRNVTIDNAASAGGTFNAASPNVFTPTADSAVADRNTIQTSLNAGTSVQITTGATGAQDGDITVAASITKSAGGNATLTLTAADDIIVNADIVATTGQLGITLNADSDASGAGAITVNNALTSNGGAVSLSAATGITLAGANADITTAGGTATFNADNDGNNTGNFTVDNAGGAIATANGVVTVTAADVALTGTINSGTGGIALQPGSDARTIGIAGGAGDFSLAQAELDQLTTSGTLTIGRATGTHATTVNAVTLVADTVLIGGTPTFAGTVTGGGNDLTLNFTGATTIDGAVITGVGNLASGNGGTTTLQGNVTTAGGQTYADSVTLGAATTLASSGNGAIALNGTVNGAQTLTVNTGGATTFGGAVGGATALTSVTTDAGGTSALNGGAITTTGDQLFQDNVTLGAATTLTSSGAGNVTFAGTLNGAQTLAVNTAGTTAFDGAVGGGTALTSVTTDAGGTTALNGGAVTTTGVQIYGDDVVLGANTVLAGSVPTFGGTVDGNNNDLTLNFSGATTIDGAVITDVNDLASGGGGSTTLQGNITTSGTQTYGDNVTLGAATTLASSGNGAIALNGTVNGAQTLAVNTGGATTLGGAVGGATALTSLTTDAGGTTALNGGAVTTSGGQTYNDNVTLGAATTLASTGNGAIALNGTVNGAQTLALNTGGATTLGGVVGGGTALTSLTTDAGGTTALNGGAVTTTGGQTYNDDVTLGAGTTLASTGNGAIALGGTVNGAQTLALNTGGATTLGGAVGGTTALTSLTTSAGGTTALNGGAVTTTGAQTYNDNVTLGAATTLASTGAGDVTFGGTVNGAQALAVNTGGVTGFDGAVGGSTALTSLTTDAGGSTGINGGAVTTSGTQTYNDNVVLGGNTTLAGTTPTFGGTVDGNNNDLTLNFSGATTIDGAVITDLNDLASGGGGTTTLQGTITTTGSQTYGDSIVTPAGATTLTAGTVTFNSGISPGGDAGIGTININADVVLGASSSLFVTLNGTAPGQFDQIDVNVGSVAINAAAQLTGLAPFGYVVGDALPIIAKDAGEARTGNFAQNNEVTIDSQTFAISYGNNAATAAVTLTRDATVWTWDGGGPNDNWSTVQNWQGNQFNPSSGDSLAFAGNNGLAPVNDTFAGLVLNQLLFNANAGNFVISGGGISLQNGIVNNSPNLQTLNLPVTLVANASINAAAGQISFGALGTINGGFNLALNGGNLITLGAAAGGVTPLASVTTAAPVRLDGGAVTTSGAQTYNGTVALGADTTLAGTTPTFGATLTGNNNDLTLNFSGATAINGAVITGVNDLATGGGGTATLQGNITTTGAQTFADDVTLGAATTLAGTTATFGGTFDGGNNDLTLNLSGATTIDGGVIVNVNDLASGGGGATTLLGAITTSGNQTYTDDVVLAGNVSVASSGNGNIAFNGAVDADDAVNNDRTLTVNAGTGNATFAGNVGTAQALADLDVTAATINLDGPALTVDDQGGNTLGFNGAVDLGADVTINTGGATGNNVTFANTVDGAQDLTVNSGGTVAFDGAIGGTTPLASLTTDAGGLTALNGGAVTTTGAQTYNDVVNLGANTVLAGTTPAFGGTLTGNGNDLTLSFSGATLIDGAVITGVNDLTSNGGGATSLQGVITTTGTQTYDDGVTLAAATTVVSLGAGAAGDVSFNGTVGGAQDLAVNTAGTTTFGDAVNLGNLTTDDAAGADTTVLGANVTTSGTQTYGDEVVLATDVTLAGTSATFGSVLTGNNNNLTLNFSGATLIDGAGITGVADLASGGGGTTTLQGTVTTSGSQTYDDDVNLGAATTLVSSGNAGIALNGAVDGAQTLAINTGGTTTFGGAVGGATALTGITTDAAGTTALNGGTVTTSGNQTYNDNVNLGAATTLASTGAGDVTFAGTVNGAQTLAVNTTGTTAFDGVVGGGTALTSLTTDAGGTTALNGGAVTTTGAQVYNDTVVLGANTTLAGTTPTFGGTLDGNNNDLTLSFSGITLIDGAVIIDVNDLVSNGGGTTTLQGALTTSGTQTYDEAVNLGGATTVASTGAGAAGDIDFNGTVNGAQTLAVNTAGTTTFAAAIGNTTALTSLTTDAPGSLALNAGTITTTGGQTYGDATVLGAATTATSTGGGNIDFNGTLDGAEVLTVNTAGTTGFGGAVGGATPLTSITTDAPGTVLLTGGSIITSGAQTYNDPVNLGADTAFSASTLTFGGGLNPNGFAVGTVTVGDQIFANPYILSADTFLVSTAGKIEFLSTVNSDGTPRSLTLNTPGDTIFGGAVGAISPLQNLTTDAAGQTLINGGQVNALGTVTFNDPVVLGADTTLSADTATFASTVNAAAAGVQGLTVNTDGFATFGGAVGSVTALESLTTDIPPLGGLVELFGDVTTTGPQVYGESVYAGGNLNGNGITFGGILFGASATLNGTGNQSINAGTGGIQGGTIKKTTTGDLTINADGGINLGGGSLRAESGSLTVDDALVAGIGSVSASQNVSLVDVTAGAVSSQNGNVTIQGSADVSDVSAPLGSVSISGSANVLSGVIAGTSVTIGGAATIDDDVTAGTTVQFGAASDVNGNIAAGGAATFAGPANVGGNVTGTGIAFNNTATLDGGADQTINAGTGTLTANSTVIKTGTGSLTLAGDSGVNVTGNLAVSPAGGSLTVQDNLVAGAAVNAGQNITLAGASSTVTGDVNALGGNVTAGALSAANVSAGGGVTATSLNAGNVNAGAAVSVANNATLTGVLSAGGAASVGGTADINGNVTAGGLVSFGGPATLAGNVNGVGITFNDTAALDGAAAQTVDAGTGALNAGATVTKTGAGNLALGGDAGANVTGNLAVNTAGGSLAVTDNLTAGGTVSAPQDVNLANANITGALTATAGNLTGGTVSAASVTAGGNATLAGVAAGTVTTGGSLNVAGAATVPGAVTAGTSIVLGGASTLGDNVTAGNGITFGGLVTLNGAAAQTIHAGIGTLLASAAVNKTVGSGLNLAANEIDFNGGPGSVTVTGGGVLSIQTTHASGSFGLGNLTAGNTPNRLDLSATDTAALGGGFSEIVIGNTTDTREILIGSGATFGSPLSLNVNALGAANVAIQEELTGSLAVSRLSIDAVGQVLLGNAGAGTVADTLQPANQIAQLGDVSVTGNFYLYDSDAPVAYAPGEEGPLGSSPFFLDANVDNRRGLELAGDFTQGGSGVQTVIRTLGDLNILPGVAVQTGNNNLAVLSAEVPTGAGFLANFHNAGATDANGVVVDPSTDGITVGSGSQLLVFSSDANFNTFQRGAAFNVNSSAQNGTQPVGGQFHFGRIVTTPPPNPPFSDPENFEAIFGQVIAPNVFTFAPGLGDVQFVIRSSNVPAPPEASKFVFFTFAPEPFAGITLDTQSFRTGIARPGTEIRTHSSLLYDFEEWNRQGRPRVAPEPVETELNR